MQHAQVRKIYICPHALNSIYRCIYHYNTYSFSKALIHRNSLIWCPEVMLPVPLNLRYAPCLTHSASCKPGAGGEPCLPLQRSSLPAPPGSSAAGWERYLLRPCGCLIINLAQTAPSLAIFFMLDVCWEIFFFSLLCCCFGFLAWLQPKFFKLILKQGMGKWSDLFMLKASGHPLNSSRDSVIWTINLQGVKAKSLYFDLCRKLPND